MFRPMRPIRPVRAVRPVGRPLARGLVVGGAAYAAGRAGARRAADEQGQNEAIAELQADQDRAAQQQAAQQQAAQQPVYAPPSAAPAPAPAAPAAGGEDVASKLNQLAQLVQQGLLTPEEFAAAKARLLA
ncbi:SHOCT domain-containing protein [Kitasatospora phosalacinea]|uniref:SHOCT domain-containing protein n=1 Tax=Kitasatospora phosalacinea TaxID=2065 RepID=UPI000B28AAB6|nr:SHOCT domain-containing protein [Kitasatospora phosalacinea]